MNRILASAAAAAAVCAAIFGAGTANAKPDVDAYKGYTYEQVVQSVGQGNVKIVSRVGEYLSTPQCIVSGSRNGGFVDSSGNPTGAQVLVDLNCNDVSAMGGHSGNSVMTPAGKKDQQQRQSAKDISEDYAQATAAGEKSWCDENFSQCYNFCEKTSYCSAELNEFLGL